MKTTTRSTIIVIALCAIGMAHGAGERMKYAVLSIEYIGALDKPVTPIVISDSKLGAEWYRDAILKRSKPTLTYLHVVPVSLLEKLIAETELHKGILQSEQTKSRISSETVSATVVTPQKRNRLLYSAESSIALLYGLVGRCEGQDALRTDLIHFRDRIRP